MNEIFNRIMRAAMLDKDFYKEAESDTSLTQEALMIVVVVSIISGIGSFLGGLWIGKPGAAFLALIVNSALGVANYYIWAYVTHFIGTNMFAGDATPDELLRVLGYASGPRLLGVLGFIPCIGWLAALVGAIWALVAGFYGVREALDLDTTETLITVFLGWLAVLIISLLVNGIFGFNNLRDTTSMFGR
ncbi:MAG: YIP1 family protein [Anaerolineales bacterium]|jgi:hypothetical protein